MTLLANNAARILLSKFKKLRKRRMKLRQTKNPSKKKLSSILTTTQWKTISLENKSAKAPMQLSMLV